MTPIHLDTGFLIRALVSGTAEDAQLRQWLRRRQSIAISAVAWAEFLCGPVDGDARALAGRIVGEPSALTAAHAELAAALFNGGGRRRGTLADCLIAAVAMDGDAQLATTNPKDFALLAKAGLKIA